MGTFIWGWIINNIKSFSLTKLLGWFNILKGSNWGKYAIGFIMFIVYSWATSMFIPWAMPHSKVEETSKSTSSISPGNVSVYAPFSKPNAVNVNYSPTSTSSMITQTPTKKSYVKPWYIPTPYLYGQYGMGSSSGNLSNFSSYKAETQVGIGLRFDLDFWNWGRD